jgi:Tfp pilus assembly protein PilO
MAKTSFRQSIKHLQVSKINTIILVAASLTTVVVIFSFVGSISLYKQMKYQNKVIDLRNKANKQLEKNIKSVAGLVYAYDNFEKSSESILGTADRNSKIALDALPSKYDFPALTASLEGVAQLSGVAVTAITGTDQEATATQDSANPKPIEIPFQITVKGSFASIKQFVVNLQRSIRPIQVQTIIFSGNDSDLEANVTAKTYYQPEKRLDLQQAVVPGPNSAQKSTTQKTGSNQ